MARAGRRIRRVPAAGGSRVGMVVQAIWAGVHDLGFTGGRVLEPGCGSGNFIAFAPAEAQLTGVELEPVTAGIAAALYPDAQIRSESFAHRKPSTDRRLTPMPDRS